MELFLLEMSCPADKGSLMNMQRVTLRSASLLLAATWIGTVSAAPLPSLVAHVTPANTSQMDAELSPRLRRQVVSYRTDAPAGTIVIDTAHTVLYYVRGDGTAIRYGIGVGRDGFTWAGSETVTRMAEWPDWTPPQEMIARQPYLPRWMAGGEGNPLGARGIYLGSTVYRIHGTNMPETIGHKVSSGCIRMLNKDVIDLYSRVTVGAKVIVLPSRLANAIQR